MHFDEVSRRIFEIMGLKMYKKTGKCILQHRKWNLEPRTGCWKLESGTQMMEMVLEGRRATDPGYIVHSYRPVSPRSPGGAWAQYINRYTRVDPQQKLLRSLVELEVCRSAMHVKSRISNTNSIRMWSCDRKIGL